MKLKILRRNLLKWAGFLAVELALPNSIRAQDLQEQEQVEDSRNGVVQPKEKPLPKLESEAYKPAVCKLCPALCMLQIRMVNGKPVGVSGLPGHPLNQGAICPKGNVILQELYHPDRLRSPLRQEGPRGSGKWKQISWDEAHQILYAKLAELMRRNKPEALAILAAPIRDIRHEIQKRFAEVFGTPNFWEWGWSLGEIPLDAFKAMHAYSEGLFYDLMNANLIVSFGWDWLQAFPSPVEAQRAYSELRRGRLERRARMIQIEPRLSITASKADEWISIKPGPDTEGILALGIAHLLIKEEIFDKEFVGEWTKGFEEFKKLALSEFSPDKVSQLTDVKVRRIQQLADEMAFVKPSLAITYRGSLFNQVAIHSLNVLVGSIGVRRGVLSTEAGKYQLTLPAVSSSNPKAQPLASLHQLPEVILTSVKTPIEVFWMERVNPVFLSPQPDQWKKALEKIPFIVSFSSFLDESSQLSDLVLPPHASLEAWQYGFSTNLQGSGVISFAPPVIEPFYDTGDHGDFILKLAKSLGGELAQSLPWESFLESLQTAVSQAEAEEPMRKGDWWEYEAAEANVRATLKTESGKLEFPMGILESKVQPWTERSERQLSKESQESYPLHLYVHVPLAFSFGEGAHLSYLHSIAGAHLGEEWETWVEIHPLTAEKLGIEDRQMVWVESPIGKIKVRARHYEGIRQDTVSIPFGLGHTAMGRYANGIGSNPAEIIQREVDASGQLLWQGARVKIYAG